MMWGAGAVSVTRTGFDQVTPWSVETESQPVSAVFSPNGKPAWVSQLAYRLPAESTARAPSIHHSSTDIVPLLGPIATGFFHQVWPPSADEVNSVTPGPMA